MLAWAGGRVLLKVSEHLFLLQPAGQKQQEETLTWRKF